MLSTALLFLKKIQENFLARRFVLIDPLLLQLFFAIIT